MSVLQADLSIEKVFKVSLTAHAFADFLVIEPNSGTPCSAVEVTVRTDGNNRVLPVGTEFSAKAIDGRTITGTRLTRVDERVRDEVKRALRHHGIIDDHGQLDGDR